MLNHVTLLLMFSCMKEQCLDNNICFDKYGQMRMAEFADCSIQNCKDAASRCLIQTINDIVTEMKKENPSASIESLWIQAGKTVTDDMIEFSKCLKMFGEKPIDSVVCMLDAVLTLTQEDNKKSTDQAYIVCWIEKFINGVTGCVSHYDLQTIKTLTKYLNELNQELSECAMKILPQYSKMCIPASMRLFGNNKASQFSDNWKEYSDCFAAFNDVYELCMNVNFAHHDSFPPFITTFAKDIYICGINEMISATAAC
ncbi:uncharacterized protein LOC124399553 [Silurus meridionalis]|uniref:uncharacterized protein LOC124399553 n=1 Tax=Silurus meridionalis TaxID=175797 RepID=UPI001EEA7BD8|nr:uncharacterized protein LOC124399553 [Silurus meridionalis]